MTFTANISSFENSLMNRIQTMRQRYADARAWRAVFNQTYKELQACSNRELNDLGFSRADIYDVARQSADGV